MTRIPPRPLFSTAFVLLGVASFMAFCNLAVFYGFHAHMERLGLPQAWRGPLLALEPFAALVLRPVISPFLTLRNGVRGMALGLLLAATALSLYPQALEVWSLACVRVLHGAGFSVLVSSLVTLVVHVIPRERSGQGFSLFTLTTLVPMAAVPPLVEFLLPVLGNEAGVYQAAAPVMLGGLALLPVLARHVRVLAAALPARDQDRPTWTDIRENFRIPGVLALLAAALALFTATSGVFFFAREAAAQVGMANPGLFFTVVTLANAILRLVGSTFFDRVDKPLVLGLSLVLLAGSVAAMPLARTPWAFLALAAVYGTGQGVSMPLMSTVAVLISPPRLRGLNSNLLLFAMDAGFSFGPLLAGALHPLGLDAVFHGAGVLALGSALTVMAAAARLRRSARQEETQGH